MLHGYINDIRNTELEEYLNKESSDLDPDYLGYIDSTGKRYYCGNIVHASLHTALFFYELKEKRSTESTSANAQHH